MFTEKWRQYWGLQEDPFACEDADKDPVLAQIDASAVHSGFDKVFGNPRMPAPGIVFGEKGSGKSGLRRMMRRRAEAHNEAHPDARVFFVEYIDFDYFIEQCKHAEVGSREDEKAGDRVVASWTITDHLDAMLSLAVTKLVDSVLADKARARRLPRKQKIDLLMLSALYYRSRERTTEEATRRLSHSVHQSFVREGGIFFGCILLTVLWGMLGAAPHLLPQIDPTLEVPGVPIRWYGAGLCLTVITWTWWALARQLIAHRAKRAVRAPRVLSRDPRGLSRVLGSLPRKERKEYQLPAGADPSSRYELLTRFTGLLESLGYAGAYIVMDRVDEPSLLSRSEDRMRDFVQRILDIKLLQFPGIALKLFLPIEMEGLYRNASTEDLKRMRLDKSNLIGELKWTGQELYEIANQRMLACSEGSGRAKSLADLFDPEFDFQYLKGTLAVLGTPRYAFGFLSALMLEYVRELPGELPDGDPAWGIPRSHFDIVRAGWIDRAGILRRSLN